VNESGRTGLTYALKTPPPGKNAVASPPEPPSSRSLRDRRKRSRQKTLDRVASLGDLEVKR
jgi:hypothetical protein